jgi:hypothetical protein
MRLRADSHERIRIMNNAVTATLLAGLWIGFSEFLRNELLFKSYWLEKYESLGLTFPSTPINNAVWAVWSFVLAGLIVFLSGRLRLVETVAVAWIAGFVMMWLVIGNMNVLPFGLLWIAVPWSVVEVWAAAVIARRLAARPLPGPQPPR